MSRRHRQWFALLAVFVAAAEATPFATCCDVRSGWAVGAEIAVIGITTEEIVEALPGHAAEDLSRLIWEARAALRESA